MSLGACAGALIGALAAPPGGVLVGAVAGPAGITFSSHRKRRALLKKRRAAVAEACLALAGELRNGQAPEHALQAAATEWPEFFGPAVGRAAAGGDPALALRHTAAEPGAAPLSSIAAAWEVSNQTGASLSAVLTAVTDSLRAEESVRREADAQLASVRATSRLLAILPVATLLLFSTSGTERTPVEFWIEWFDACLNTLIDDDGRVVPLLVAIGNHEVRGFWWWGRDRGRDVDTDSDAFREEIAPYFYNLFPFPGHPGYNVLDFGDYMSLLLLDTDHSGPIEGQQTSWLEEQLAARPFPVNVTEKGKHLLGDEEVVRAEEAKRTA
jgi:tight adherence protein B